MLSQIFFSYPIRRRVTKASALEYHLMQVKSIAECSKRAFCNSFYFLSLRPLLCLFLSGPIKTGFTVLLFQQLVDMRWGVPVETSDDHLATALCLQEITNCQKLSTGPNFVVSLL